MKRLSRHTVVVLLVLLVSSIGGMSLAVVAFGQSGADPDATVPLGDYTATTPSTSTAPLSGYGNTSTTPSTSTTPLSSYTNTSTTQTTQTTSGAGSKPTRTTPSGATNLPS